MTIDTDLLEQRFTLTIRQNFREALARAETEIKKRPQVPVDTGLLRNGIRRQGDTRLLGVTLKGAIQSTTKRRDFDYPRYLNERSRAYLDGRPNEHFDWWDRAWNEGLGDGGLWAVVLRKELDNEVIR